MIKGSFSTSQHYAKFHLDGSDVAELRKQLRWAEENGWQCNETSHDLMIRTDEKPFDPELIGFLRDEAGPAIHRLYLLYAKDWRTRNASDLPSDIPVELIRALARGMLERIDSLQVCRWHPVWMEALCHELRENAAVCKIHTLHIVECTHTNQSVLDLGKFLEMGNLKEIALYHEFQQSESEPDWTPLGIGLAKAPKLEKIDFSGALSPAMLPRWDEPQASPSPIRHIILSVWNDVIGSDCVERIRHVAAGLETLEIPVAYADPVKVHSLILNLRKVRTLKLTLGYDKLDPCSSIRELLDGENEMRVCHIGGVNMPIESIDEIVRAKHCNLEKIYVYVIPGDEIVDLLRTIRGNTRIRDAFLGRQSDYIHRFYDALNKNRFQVMQTILSVRFCPRLAQGSYISEIPWIDHIGRIADTLDWDFMIDLQL